MQDSIKMAGRKNKKGISETAGSVAGGQPVRIGGSHEYLAWK